MQAGRETSEDGAGRTYSAFGVAPATASTNCSNCERTLGRTGHGVPNVALRRSVARWSRRYRMVAVNVSGRGYGTAVRLVVWERS